MTKEQIALLKRIRNYLPNHSGFGTTNAVYITPAQQLRNRADEIEQQGRDEKAFNELISELEGGK